MGTTMYQIRSDVRTNCHCGHVVKEGEEYFMLRTDVPRWLSLCTPCVSLISNPIRIEMGELVRKYYETNPPDGRSAARRAGHEKMERGSFRNSMSRGRAEQDAEWV